ncbi:hypothetical protein R3P38DRAFT_3508162 [Favolaschia claudopus]|uniref:Uncharacterized protein n=1 Tax=Favolaschia claudopus TaxID=2862362 RepID=A0AAW0C2W2_9AGAR
MSAALSDESVRRLRYCLNWLQYATQHIDAQILILRDFIASLHPYPPDIVHTIRQVVGVVLKYTGGALPEPARGRVRGWGGETSAGGNGTGRRSAPRSQHGASAGVVGVGEAASPTMPAPSSPHAHYRALHPHAHGHGEHTRRASAQDRAVEPGRALAAAQRVLVLAAKGPMAFKEEVALRAMRTTNIEREGKFCLWKSLSPSSRFVNFELRKPPSRKTREEFKFEVEYVMSHVCSLVSILALDL